jgi:hypothetical protein
MKTRAFNDLTIVSKRFPQALVIRAIRNACKRGEKVKKTLRLGSLESVRSFCSNELNESRAWSEEVETSYEELRGGHAPNRLA